MSKNKNNREVVTSNGCIMSCRINPDCADLKFGGLQISPADYDTIAEWIQEHDTVKVCICNVQDVLPASEKTGPKRVVNLEGSIVSCRINPDCADIKFDGLQVSPEDYDTIAGWIQSHYEIRLQICNVQDKLFLKEKKE